MERARFPEQAGTADPGLRDEVQSFLGQQTDSVVRPDQYGPGASSNSFAFSKRRELRRTIWSAAREIEATVLMPLRSVGIHNRWSDLSTSNLSRELLSVLASLSDKSAL